MRFYQLLPNSLYFLHRRVFDVKFHPVGILYNGINEAGARYKAIALYKIDSL